MSVKLAWTSPMFGVYPQELRHMVISIIIYQQMAVQLLADKQAHISCLYHLDIRVSPQLGLYTTILSYRKVSRKAYLSA